MSREICPVCRGSGERVGQWEDQNGVWHDHLDACESCRGVGLEKILGPKVDIDHIEVMGRAVGALDRKFGVKA